MHKYNHLKTENRGKLDEYYEETEKIDTKTKVVKII